MPLDASQPAQEAADTYPLEANAALYDSAQAEAYLETLFRNVNWKAGQLISLLGIGEKGTPQDGSNGKPPFRERKILTPEGRFTVHAHLKRWAGHHVAGFVVPAVLHPDAGEAGDVKLDKVAALTAIILDLDSGDTDAKASYVNAALGQPSMVVASGGTTEAGKPKLHIYWLFNEPCEEVERVAEARKLLASKVGGDQSFGRATQVVRVAGSVHAKNGKASVCRILSRSAAEYSFDDLAEAINGLQPMPGIEPPKATNELPRLGPRGVMDFTPNFDTATAALHRDIREGGEDLTRYSEFSKVAGFNINSARAGRIGLDEAHQNTRGWMLQHMVPPWPEARFESQFRALVNVDIARHGPMPQQLPADQRQSHARILPLEFFSDIEPILENNWLVRGYLTASSLVLTYGWPGTGKSFFVLDIALRIALGLPFNGSSVKQGAVIYLAAEAGKGMRNRIAAFKKHHLISRECPFALLPLSVDLFDRSADLQSLIATINWSIDRLGRPPILLVLDTLAATFGAGDENTKDMLAYINNVAHIRDHCDTTIWLVHHRPKDQMNNTPRGHSSLMGAMDTILSLEADRSQGVTIVTTTKQKESEPGAPISFSLSSVQLGVDDEGQAVTSAVIEYTELRPSNTLSPNTQLLLQALETAIERSGRADVSGREWRVVWEELTPEKQGSAREKAFSRGRKQLSILKRIENNGDRWSISLAPDASGPA